MTKEELKKLSDDTFTSNNTKQITADKQRDFNNHLIEAMTTQKDFDAYEIPDGTVTNEKVADNSISESKILDYAVTNDKIANGAVDNKKLEDGAVTLSKLSTDALQILMAGSLKSDGTIEKLYNPLGLGVSSAKVSTGYLTLAWAERFSWTQVVATVTGYNNGYVTIEYTSGVDFLAVTRNSSGTLLNMSISFIVFGVA